MIAGESRGADAPSPFLFVVGCPRSGTTLLQRMLDAHPELAVANDTHFISRAVRVVAPALARGDDAPIDAATERALIDWSIGYRRFGRLGLSDEAIEHARRAESFVEFVAEIYRALAARHGKRWGGEKTPDYVRSLPLLRRLFPRTPIVHIVRDGREVALSLLDWAEVGKGPGRFALWRDEPLATAALWWRWQVASGRRAAANLPADAVHELRYARLVAEPRAELERLAAFLGLGEVDAMLAFHEGKTRRGAGRSAKSSWLPPTPGLRDFERVMAADDLALFELLAGDLLDELGEPRAADPARVAAAALVRRAEDCRERFQAELVARKRKEQPEAQSAEAGVPA